MRKFDSIIDLRNAFANRLGIVAYFPADDDDKDKGDSGDDDKDKQNDDDLDDDGGDGGDDDDVEKLKKDHQDKKLAQENARRRRENRELTAELQALKDEKKSETQLLKDQADRVPELEATVSDLRIENAILIAADQYEVNDREVLSLLITKNKSVKVEDGEVVGLDEAIKEIKKTKPKLFGKPDDDKGKEKAKESGTNGASGRATNENKDNGDGPNIAELQKKFPALRR